MFKNLKKIHFIVAGAILGVVLVIGTFLLLQKERPEAIPEVAEIVPIEIEFWHAMGGALGEKTNELVARFNEYQDRYRVVPVFRGSYTETMTAAIAAFRANEQPHIVQVFEVGTYSMMLSGAIKPVYEVMQGANLPFNPQDFVQPVITYYSLPDGRMLSMPFNSSTPVLFYNKNAFKKAGLDPNRPPVTWHEVAEFARKIKEAGFESGFTTTWQSWVMIENFSAWHNAPLATHNNGFGGLGAELTINSPLHVRHIAQLAKWKQEGLFSYGGRRSEAADKFINQETAMIFGSSAGLAGYRAAIEGWEFGVGKLPYWPDVEGAPQNSIIGGASLWIFDGHAEEEYRGIAEFLNFLASPELQLWWHLKTGYIPITTAAYELGKKRGYYNADPFQEVAILQMMNKPPTSHSKGLRLGNFVQIRDVINDELEYVWGGKKTAQQAMDDAVRRGNEFLRKFEDIHR